MSNVWCYKLMHIQNTQNASYTNGVKLSKNEKFIDMVSNSVLQAKL